MKSLKTSESLIDEGMLCVLCVCVCVLLFIVTQFNRNYNNVYLPHIIKMQGAL